MRVDSGCPDTCGVRGLRRDHIIITSSPQRGCTHLSSMWILLRFRNHCCGACLAVGHMKRLLKWQSCTWEGNKHKQYRTALRCSCRLWAYTCLRCRRSFDSNASRMYLCTECGSNKQVSAVHVALGDIRTREQMALARECG